MVIPELEQKTKLNKTKGKHQSKQVIQFVLTGGTIDSYYDGTKDTVVPSKTSAIPNYIEKIKLYDKIEFTEVCMKDSRDITEADVEHTLKVIEESPHSKIIITHGTYTMPDTARFLKANLKRKDQTIIFTGSLIPLIGFGESDGPFNLGYSIAKVKDLDPGIYVCMNGRVFSPEEVVKMLSEGRYSSVFRDKQ